MNEVGKDINKLLKAEEPARMRRAYKREHARLVALGQQSAAFNQLLERFPEEDMEARSFLHAAYAKSRTGQSSVSMDMNTGTYEYQEHMPLVLNHEELEKLKAEDPQLYDRISSTYLDYLVERSGLKDKSVK